MLSALVAAALLAMAVDSGTVNGQLRGRVIDDAAEWPLPRAEVRLAGASTQRLATTGPDGAFLFPDLPAGSYTLVVSREAYDSASLQIVLPEMRVVIVDVQLVRRPSALQPVVVLAPPPHDVARAQMTTLARTDREGHRALRMLDLLSHTGGTLTSVLGAPAPQRPPEPGGTNGHTLFVWGANDETGRVLLDGATIGAPLHLGGLLPSIDPELIDDARMRTGGASARFDGGTGYVLELSTRAPSAGSLRLWGESDLLTDRVGGEIPLGDNGSILAGARRVRSGMLPRLSGVVRGYAYGDVLTRAGVRTGARGRVHAMLFGTDEALRIPRDQGSDEATWRNRAASIVWQSDTAVARTTLRLSAASAMTDLPLLSALGGHLRGDVDRVAFGGERRWARSRWQVSVGGEMERAWLARETRVTSAGAPRVDTSASPFVAAGRCGPGDACAHVAGSTAALYGDVRYAASERVRLDAGLRLAADPYERSASRVDVLPRLALEALVAPRTTLRLAAGRYSRLGAHFSDRIDRSAARTEEEGSAPPLLDARVIRDYATHLEAGATQQWGRSQFGLSTYLHRREGAPVGASFDRAVGLDASWSFTGERLSAGAGYMRIARTYHRSTLPDGSSIGAQPTLAPSPGVEHLVSMNAAVSVWRLRMSVAGGYARGVPYTSVVLDRPTDALRGSGTPRETWSSSSAPPARSYVRLDATVSGTWCVGGGACQLLLSPYVRVINALDRRDALFYYQGDGVDHPRALAALPAILSVGIRWEAARAKR